MTEVILSKPITVIDQQIDRIIFRAPKGRDLVGLPNFATDTLGALLVLAERLAMNVPGNVVSELPADDAFAVGRVIGELLNPTMPASSSTAISTWPAGGTTSAS